jgi:chaperonin GroES
MRLQPLGDKIIVKRMEASETTAGGIVLPDTARERPQQGRVLSVGDGRRLSDGTYAAPQVQEGDRVVFANYAGSPVVVENEELLILREADILAVLD